MKSKSGFTIVELLVALVIIALMATLMGVTYIKIQAQTRDAKRRADIETLASSFEKYYDKNGEYPTGCSRYQLVQKTSCSPSTIPLSVSTEIYVADTTLTTLQQKFPQLPNDFGDPLRTSATYPFGLNNTTTNSHYVFFGQFDSNTISAVTSVIMGAGKEIDCTTNNVSESVPAGALPKSTTFVLAYLSELDQKWYIYQGKRGYELVDSSAVKVRGRSIGTKCVFVQ